MKMMARMSPVAEQKTARDALVLPVDAQAARRAPARWACVNAAVMPLSLKLPDGFKPSYCKNREPGFKPTKVATLSARCKMVCPSPMVRILSGWAKGSSSRKRLLDDQNMTVPELHRRMQRQGLRINLKSLYRL